MNNKTRSDSLLSQLTEDQQTQVYDWLMTLGYTKTLARLAQPPPDGFDLKTHRNSLLRFYKRYQQEARTEDLADAKESRSSPEDASVLVSDAEQSYVHAAHQLATGPMNSTDFSKVGRWLESRKEEQFKHLYARLAEQNAAIAQKKAALADKRHAFDREKYELNVARLAFKHTATLQRIHGDSDLDIQARIQAARELIYGPPPEPDSIAGALQPAQTNPETNNGQHSSN